MTDEDLERLLRDLESDQVERKSSFSDRGRVCEAICAFANDLANRNQPGVVLIGATDQGGCSGLEITDELLRNVGNIRSDGNVLPFPAMTVEKRCLSGCDMIVVVVQPSLSPPVKYNGRIWIRVGPQRATATAEEERRLNEKRRFRDLPHDLWPMPSARLDDLDLNLFRDIYLPSAVAPEVLAENQRSVEHQLTTVRFLSGDTSRCPTVAGLLSIGTSPASFVPGAYVQFLRIDGVTLADPIADQKEIHGPLPDLLRRLDEILDANIRIATDIQSAATEIRQPDYPLVALQQVLRNAVMHRDYFTSNAPVRLTWFTDRIEVQNPGGPYGQVSRTNFGQSGITDYRNPTIAGVMKDLGYVQKFGMGLGLARDSMAKNGNPEPEFQVEETCVLVTLRKRP